MTTNIAFLIPSTSKGHHWESPKDSYLYKYTLSTLSNCNHFPYCCIFYIGFDNDDSYYKNKKNQIFYKKTFPYFTFRFIQFDNSIKKGHLTKMWNILYYNALIDNNYFIEYFYQCGDDIIFKTQYWIEKSINELQYHNNIGVSGPRNEHPHLLTQALITRKHYTIFNCLFPECIVNWGCDDWLNYVYSPNYLNVVNNELAINVGGNPRYNVNFSNEIKIKEMAYKIAKEDRIKIIEYIEKETKLYTNNKPTKNSSSFALMFY